MRNIGDKFFCTEGRIYFDAFVLKNKKDGIFVSVNSSYVADEAVTDE